MENRRRIAIVGGGASGTLLAVNLLRRRFPVVVDLIEKKDKLGLGVAYSTPSDFHLLNVPAAKMGAFPDDLEHFHRWLSEHGHEYAPSSFVPRKLFGGYLRDLLREAIATKSGDATFNLRDDEAIDIESQGEDLRVAFKTGAAVDYDTAVLAFGNFLPPHPTVADQAFTSAPKYFRNPWSEAAANGISPDDDVLIIGTGLSMVDMVMRLERTGHAGRIAAISTRGILPATHRLGYTYPTFVDELRGRTRVTDLLKTVRSHIDKAEIDGSDWRAVIDALRPHTQEIWLGLPVAEKRYFMQHLSRYWNAARHRMPPEAAEVIEKLRQNGRLTVLKGRLRSIDHDGGKFHVIYTANGTSGKVSADAILNCIGSESNFERIESELIENMLRRGSIRRDALSLGLDVTPDGRLIGSDGAASDRLYTLGTSMKGVLWESTAIPEIRVQARDLAEAVLCTQRSS